MTELPDNARGRLLAAANQCVNADRNVSYGDPNADFGRTSKYWNIHATGVLERKLVEMNLMMDPALRVIVESLFDTWDVAIMIGQVKQSRLAWSPGKLDNWVDTAGYAATGADCVIAAGLAQLGDLPPTEASPVDPPSMQLDVPPGFDPMNPIHVVRLLQQMPGVNEPPPHEVMKMTVNEYAWATGRQSLLEVIQGMRSEGDNGGFDPDEMSVGYALRAEVAAEAAATAIEAIEVVQKKPKRPTPQPNHG